MYENAVPVYEMKNKLSFFLHKVDNGEQVCISVRGKPAYQILTIDEVEKLKANAPKEKTIFEAAAELRKKYGIEDDDPFDFSEHLEKLRREEAMIVSEREERYLKELLDE